MIDLSHKAVHQFWSSFPDDTIYRVIACMEGMESWTADGDPGLEKALVDLGKELVNIEKIDLKQEDNLINLGAYLKMGRNLRILMALDQAYPGSASKILMHAEKITKSNKDSAGLFLRRNLVFERLRLISRTFSPQRIKMVQQCLEDDDE